MSNEKITEKMLNMLREEIRGRLSEGRFIHTEGVEKTAAAISEIYAPGLVQKMRAAALLHDFTKEYSLEKQLKICHDFGIILRDDEKSAPLILHSITAAALIPSEFPEYVCDEIIGAVRWHTTGHAGMTLPEKILCLADYIEDGRKYSDCIAAREVFWGGHPEKLGESERISLLDRTLVISLENTVAHVEAKGGVVNRDTYEALKYLGKNN
jgi:nicotinate-nucleotide adenylyltransferase